MFQDCDQSFGSDKWKMQLWALALTELLYPPSFCTPTNTDISSNLYPGSAVWFHVTNHHIKCCHFRRNTLPSIYWFQIKRQYFHSSISVCLFCVSLTLTPTEKSAPLCTHTHTHLLFSPRSLILY